MTVKQLRQLLADIPDNYIVEADDGDTGNAPIQLDFFAPPRRRRQDGGRCPNVWIGIPDGMKYRDTGLV